MYIRIEEPKDYQIVENLTRDAFWNVYVPGCAEHLVIHNLRKSKDFIPELSLVGETEGKIIAHIAYTKAKIMGENGKIIKKIITFGPLSVSPFLQKKGLGAEIVEYSLEKARNMGYTAICIYGNPKYYSRFGFRCGEKFDIKTADGKFAPALMAMELKKDALKNSAGKFDESPDFNIDEKELEEFEKIFPDKEKKETESQKEFQFLANLRY